MDNLKPEYINEINSLHMPTLVFIIKEIDEKIKRETNSMINSEDEKHVLSLRGEIKGMMKMKKIFENVIQNKIDIVNS